MRGRLKSAIERVLSRGGPAGISRRLRRDQVLVLAYHNVRPDDVPPQGDASLHLSRSDFAAQLEVLAELCDVVPLATVLSGGSTGRPRVAITFDDAYRGTVELGVAEVARRGLPATIFVPPAFLGGHTFWWDVLSEPATRRLPEELRTRVLTELQGSDARIRDWAAASGVPLHPVDPWLTGASEADLAGALRRFEGLTLGAHSWSHPNLASLPEAELRAEVERPFQWLLERFPERTIRWISYPYGLRSPLVERVVAQAGYDAALLVTGGWMTDTANRYSLPRFNVPAGISLDGYALRLSGLLAT